MQCVDNVLDMVREVDVIVLAVKPHQALPLLSKYSLGLSQYSPKILVSVVAGVTIEDLQKVGIMSTCGQHWQRLVVNQLHRKPTQHIS